MEGETVGQRIRRLRLAGGFSQRGISGPGVSYAFISRIEHGTRSPSVKALRLLARKLGVSAEYLEHGYERTLTDDRLDELVASSPDVWAVGASPDGVTVYWKDEEGTRVVRAATLTEALEPALAAVHAQRSLIVERERLRLQLADVEAKLNS